MAHYHRRIEGNFNQGWPVAIFITALAVAAFVTAGLIKSRTYHDPVDPLGGASSASHGAPAAAAH